VSKAQTLDLVYTLYQCCYTNNYANNHDMKMCSMDAEAGSRAARHCGQDERISLFSTIDATEIHLTSL